MSSYDDEMNGNPTEHDVEQRLEMLRELMERLRSQSDDHETEGREDADDEEEETTFTPDEDEDEDEDTDDADEDEDEEEEDEDEDDEEEDNDADDMDDDDNSTHRLLLQKDFSSKAAYTRAVTKEIGNYLRSRGIHAMQRTLHDGVYVFVFDRTTRGVDVDGRIFTQTDMTNLRIDFKLNVDNEPGRAPLLNDFIARKNWPLRYGGLIMDPSDGEKKIEYSFNFEGCFSMAVFNRCFDALDSTLKVYVQEYAALASGKLGVDDRKTAQRIIGECTRCLGKVKPENEATVKAVETAIGHPLNAQMQKLVQYIIRHTK